MAKKKEEAVPAPSVVPTSSLKRKCPFCKKEYSTEYESGGRSGTVSLRNAESELDAKVDACDHAGTNFEKELRKAESSESSSELPATLKIVVSRLNPGDTFAINNVLLKVIAVDSDSIELSTNIIPDAFLSKFREGDLIV